MFVPPPFQGEGKGVVIYVASGFMPDGVIFPIGSGDPMGTKKGEAHFIAGTFRFQIVALPLLWQRRTLKTIETHDYASLQIAYQTFRRVR